MSELERELHALAGSVAWPAEPDLAAAVRAQLGAEPPRRIRLRLDRRSLAVAFAVLVLALAGVLAVPSARSAILEWLGIPGVELEFVDELPGLAVTNDLQLGERVRLADARRRAGYELVRPPEELGKPLIYFREPPEGGQVAFVYGTLQRMRLLIAEFRGSYEPYITKIIDSTTTDVDRFRIGGEPALWLDGAHLVAYEDEVGTFVETARLANKVLLWERDGLTFRLEGALTKEQAVEVAEAMG
ncbi:MAG: hypothetical protein ABR583_02520 [Gaiellaceae bacterium]